MRKVFAKFPGLRVLVAEDHPLNMEVLIRMLSYFDIIPEQARDGQETIEKFRQAEFDLVILDIHMPKKTGFDVIRHIRSLPLHQPVVVALTASAEEIDAVGYGFDSFLTKPIDLAGIERILKKFSKRRWSLFDLNFLTSSWVRDIFSTYVQRIESAPHSDS